MLGFVTSLFVDLVQSYIFLGFSWKAFLFINRHLVRTIVREHTKLCYQWTMRKNKPHQQ